MSDSFWDSDVEEDESTGWERDYDYFYREEGYDVSSSVWAWKTKWKWSTCTKNVRHHQAAKLSSGFAKTLSVITDISDEYHIHPKHVAVIFADLYWLPYYSTTKWFNFVSWELPHYGNRLVEHWQARLLRISNVLKFNQDIRQKIMIKENSYSVPPLKEFRKFIKSIESELWPYKWSSRYGGLRRRLSKPTGIANHTILEEEGSDIKDEHTNSPVYSWSWDFVDIEDGSDIDGLD